MSNNFEHQPDELNALKKIVEEFIDKYKSIENEIDILKEDQKELFEEYKEKLDVKTLKLAMRTVKIKKNVTCLDTFETFVDILETKECV